MKKYRLYVLLVFLLIVTASVIIAIRMYNKPHVNVGIQKPDFTLNASELITSFMQEEQAANEKYVDKILMVTGELAGWEEDQERNLTLYLNDELFGVSCQMDTSLAKELKYQLGRDLNLGDQVRIKGKCDGILTDVKLSRCIVEY